MKKPPLLTFNYGRDTFQFCVQRLKLLASDEALAGALILVRDGEFGDGGDREKGPVANTERGRSVSTRF